MDRLPAWLDRGINLGNSLDCFQEGVTGLATQTLWANPAVTKQTVALYAKAGFQTLRVPVTWHNHMGPGPDWAIDPQWMARVRQVAGWALEENMAVIINAHHEFSWLKPDPARMEESLPQYEALWRQVALAFRDEGEKLLLQGSNEPGLAEMERCPEQGGTREMRRAINRMSQAFIRTVRETGGGNTRRWLCVPNLGARPVPECIRAMEFPEDDRLIYTFHLYLPDGFCFRRATPDASCFFTVEAKREIREAFRTIRELALPKGLPMMITEYGAEAKKLPDSGQWNHHERALYAREMMDQARELDIPCVWWDNNYLGRRDEYFGLFDRETGVCLCPEIVRECVKGSRKGQ